MGPPSASTSSSTSQAKPKDPPEITEKSRKLKRRFFELEEETSTELQRSGERNVKMREERSIPFDRFIELGNDNLPLSEGRSNASPPSIQPSSSPFPRTGLNDRTHDDTDPSSRHPDMENQWDSGNDQDPCEEDTHDLRNGEPRVTGSHNGQGSISPSRSLPTLGKLQSSEQTSSEPVILSGVHNTSASSPQGQPRKSSLSVNSQLHTQPPLSPSTHLRASSPNRQSPPINQSHAAENKRSCTEDVEMASEPTPDSRTRPKDDPSVACSRSKDQDYPDLDAQNERTHNEHVSEQTEQVHEQADNSPSSPHKPQAQAGSVRVTRRSTRAAASGKDYREVDEELTTRTRRGGKRKASTSPVLKSRLTRSESTALAAATAKAVEDAVVDPALMSNGRDSTEASQDTTHTRSAILPPTKAPIVATASTSVSVISPSPAIDPNIDPALAVSAENGLKKETSPMDAIVKVAEAAVAAQNAAKSVASSASASPAPASGQTEPTAGPSTAGPSSPSPTTYNPYMITTQMVPGKMNPMCIPGVTPLSMNPYAMYYAPGAPMPPGAPGYPPPFANPYYYLTAPMPTHHAGVFPATPALKFLPPTTQPPPSEVQRHAKPKRLKAHTVTSKSYSIPMVPRDKRGKPMLPLNVGIMTVISLGDVCMREHFHTERYIFPVGYEVTRRYLSTVDPNVEVVYHCMILDGGDGPKFQIVPSDVPDRTVIAGTATGAWSSIVKQANLIRNRQHSNSVSGPDFFGLGQNTIKHLIQELPNADRLRDYVWQTFVEGGPLGGRHAAVIPALPEEYDATMPIGAYFPADRDKLKRASALPGNPSPKGLSHYPQHIIAQAEAQRAKQAALQQAQQMGVQPLQPGEASGSGALHNQPDQSQSTALQGMPPSGPGYHQPTSSNDPTTSSGMLDGGAGMPATFASIMNAFPNGTSATPPV